MPDKPTLSYSLSLSRKVNLGGFSNSADAFECISGITAETTQEDIDALLSGPGALAYTSLRKALAKKCAEMDNDEWERLKASQADNSPALIPVIGGRQ